MADELIPPRVANGGAGSVSAGSVRGADYRQIQGPEQVRTDLPDNEAATRAAALAGLFKEFEGVSGNVYQQATTQAGALAGAAAGATGHPQYKQGFARLTAYGRAFNNAATGAYAVQAEAQADDAAARLRVQANNNPETFRATYTAVRDGVLKAAPADAVPMLTELYNKRLAAGLAAIAGDQAAQQQQLQRQTYDEGVARLTSRVAILQGSENPHDQLEAMDEHTKLSLLIAGGVKAGLYSEAEAQAMNINAMRTITAQVFQTQVDRELSKPDGDVIGLLERFRDAHQKNLSNPNEPPVLSEPEFQKLMGDATTKIREQNLLIAMNKREGKTAEQLRFEEGDKLYTSMLLQGRLSERALDAAVRSNDLKPERATALRGLMNQGDIAKSDPRALYAAHSDPNFLDNTAESIAALDHINFTDKLKLLEEVTRRNASWEGTQAVKQAKGTISAALKIPPGTPVMSLSDEQRRALVDSTQEFIGLMNATDPAKRDGSAASIAQVVIKHAQQREATADAISYTNAKQRFIQTYGPGGSESMDEQAYKTRLKHYDDLIQQSQAKAKGE